MSTYNAYFVEYSLSNDSDKLILVNITPKLPSLERDNCSTSFLLNVLFISPITVKDGSSLRDDSCKDLETAGHFEAFH